MPFGVTLPDDLGQKTVETPEPKVETTQDPKVSTAEATSPETTEEKLEALFDLDKVKRFRFEGRDWTPKEFREEYKNRGLRQEDYTKKTQEVAESRKYATNFHHDLSKVVENPELLEEFKRIYPQEYHDVAEAILERLSTTQSKGQSNTTTESNPYDERFTKQDKYIKQLESRLARWEGKLEQNERKEIGHWLDNQYATLAKKYPDAVQEIVSARAEMAAAKGVEITEEVLDKLFKQVDTEMRTHFESKYKEKVQKQLEVGAKSKDIGAGGGIPGQAPKGAKNLREARDQMLSDFGAS